MINKTLIAIAAAAMLATPAAKASKGECWGPPGEDICGTYAEVEKYKRAYKRGADCTTGTPASQQNCKDAKAGKKV
jgi:hypothetical protein